MNELSIFERGGHLLVNSRDVAHKAGKRHDNLLRDIDNILKNLTPSDLSWFIEATYIDEKGEERRSFDMTKDGFTLLSMGWSGQKWIEAKIRWIQQFNWMEAELQRRGQQDSAKLIEKHKLLEHQIAVLAASYPKASIGDVTCYEAIKELGYGGAAWQSFRKRAIAKLGALWRKSISREQWTRRGSHTGPWAFPRSPAIRMAEDSVHWWAMTWAAPDDPPPTPQNTSLDGLPLFSKKP